MDEESVIFDDVSAILTRRMLILRAGQPVNPEAWFERLPPGSRHRATFFPYELGEKVKIHYLRIEWKPREMIAFHPTDARLRIANWGAACLVNDAKDVASCVWYLEAGETISGALRSAAECFWASTGVWPKVGLMWKEPPSSVLDLTPDPSPKGEGSLSMRFAKWVPIGCVVVL